MGDYCLLNIRSQKMCMHCMDFVLNPYNSDVVGITIIPSLQMGKLRLRVMSNLAKVTQRN